MSIKECPFCGMTSTVAVHSLSKFDHSVECSHCGAMGPEEDSAEFAIKAWNEGTPRHHEVHKLRAALEQIREGNWKPTLTTPSRDYWMQQIAQEALK